MTFKLNFFHDDLYCCVKYSNAKYEVKIFKTYHSKSSQRQMVESGYELCFQDLKYFEVGSFFMFLEIQYLIESIITNFLNYDQCSVIFCFKKNSRQLLAQYHLLALFQENVDLSWNWFCHQMLNSWLCRPTWSFSSCLWFISSWNSKLVYSFESLSLNTRHESGVVHFTVLALRVGPFTIEVLNLGQRNQGICHIGSWRFIRIYYYLVNKSYINK